MCALGLHIVQSLGGTLDLVVGAAVMQAWQILTLSSGLALTPGVSAI